MIIIDPPVDYGGKFRRCSHLLSDIPGDEGRRELADFARRIGLHPEWLQHAGVAKEHYDVFGARRTRAIAAGAVEGDRRTLVNAIRR